MISEENVKKSWENCSGAKLGYYNNENASGEFLEKLNLCKHWKIPGT
jgi:hypothetical protein